MKKVCVSLGELHNLQCVNIVSLYNKIHLECEYEKMLYRKTRFVTQLPVTTINNKLHFNFKFKITYINQPCPVCKM